ncbi:MAG TPA: 3'(2'),5'-bisphosphate nucleotidase CysQ [Fimbriimonas sp.]
MSDRTRLLSSVVEIAVRAGDAILEVYALDFASYEKEDKSPLTEADLASHRIIVDALSKLTPDMPILSEESRTIPYEERVGWRTFWLVDPLDGTKEFIKRNGEFTVNIALIEDGEATLGVVYAPVLKTTFAATRGEGAWVEADGAKSPARVQAYRGGPLKIVASRSHAGPETEELIGRLRREVPEIDLVSIGSSLKICLVAQGAAHLYPRLGPTMEWDVAAAHAVASEAGARITDVQGAPLRYNKEDLLNPYFLVAAPGVPEV